MLIGLGFGVAIALYVIASRDLVSVITGRPPAPMFNGVGSLTSTRWVFANVVNSVSNSLLNGVLLSMLYVVLRQLLRVPVLAVFGATLLLSLLISSDAVPGLGEVLVVATE